MSVTQSQSIQTSTTYGDGTVIDTGSVEVDVIYDVERIDNFNGTLATGVFTMKVNGVISSERYRLMFKYSGEGNPLDQAEPALQAYFASQLELEKTEKAAAEQAAADAEAAAKVNTDTGEDATTSETTTETASTDSTADASTGA